MNHVKRFWAKARRILVLADLHAGHKAGLTHPDFNVSYSGRDAEEDDWHKRRRARQHDQRAKLWDWFASRIDAYRPFDHVWVAGDAIDGTGSRSGGTELLCTDRDEQVSMAKAALEFAAGGDADVWMVRGTPYHVGTEEEWEDVLAREVKARKIEDEGHYVVNGVQFAVKHMIGSTASPASRYTALSNSQIRQQLWALRGQQPKAGVIVRAHVHRCFYVGEPGTQSFAITCPGLQGLGSRYAVRQLDSLPVDFGFVVFDVLDQEHWSCMPAIASLELQKCTVNEM